MNQNITEKRHGSLEYCWLCVSCKKYHPGREVESVLLNIQEPVHSPFYEINTVYGAFSFQRVKANLILEIVFLVQQVELHLKLFVPLQFVFSRGGSPAVGYNCPIQHQHIPRQV